MYRKYHVCLYVFRDVSRVRGLTRDCLMAIVADIETRNWRQEFNAANNFPPEHPRSSTTDDIECFFSILRGTVGKHFTLKQVSLILYSVFVTKKDPLINEIN